LNHQNGGHRKRFKVFDVYTIGFGIVAGFVFGPLVSDSSDASGFYTAFAIVYLVRWSWDWLSLALEAVVQRRYEARWRLEEKQLDRQRHESFFEASSIEPMLFWTLSVSYQTVEIPKKTGGSRLLQIPSEDLKHTQRLLSELLQETLGHEVVDCAHAYVKERSTKSNARLHLGNSVLIKLDIKNFFPSITAGHIGPIVDRLTESAALRERILEILLSDYGLPQGAPSSPFLSNLVLRGFDLNVLRYCIEKGHRYTRYADDISISLSKDDPVEIKRVIGMVEKCLKLNNFCLNKKRQKLHVLRRHQAQRICGVTINSGKTTISRKQRRLLRAVEHRKSLGLESSMTDNQLQGHKAYVQMVMGKQRVVSGSSDSL
jgi:RNA-directed DNA polymerase